MALTELVYPGATHTRFEHALGVMEVASRAFDAIAAKRGDLFEATFQTVVGFEQKPMAKARQILRLAALLHDVGHASFSHAAEKAIFKDSGHEKLSVEIVESEVWLRKIIDQQFWDGCAERTAQIISGGNDLPPQFFVLKNLVSGEMDADRTDYLLRDSHHCGVDYGRFDHRRMIETLELQEDEAGGLEIALNRDGIHTFEALILARYQMNTQIYYHRVRRIYDLYLVKYHESLGSELPDTSAQVLSENDITMMNKIFEDSENGETERKKWANRIVQRNHHKMVYETGVNLDAIGLRKFKSLVSQVKARYGDIDFLEDISSASIHKILRTGDQEGVDSVPLTLILSKGHSRQLGEESQIIQTIPRRFQQARIYADLPRQQNELRKEVSEFTAQLWLSLGGN